jgi:Esterase-like activity of phytase
MAVFKACLLRRCVTKPGRDGVQIDALPIPARFAVTGTTPASQATGNATLEGLTIARSGREIIAAMEGALSGDVSAAGDATLRRFLVYDRGRHGNWQLTKQIAYRTETGNRIPRSRHMSATRCSLKRPRSPPPQATRSSSTPSKASTRHPT